MALRRYRMFASATATTAAADSMQFPRAGTIKQIIISPTMVSITASVTARLSISRASVSDVGNAAAGNAYLTQTLAELSLSGNFVTSGLAQMALAEVFPLSDKVNLGDLLYFHITIGGTATVATDIIIVVEE